MDELDFARYFQKNNVYSIYELLGEKIKSYQTVTRKEMLVVIYRYLDSSDSLVRYTSYEAIKFLKENDVSKYNYLNCDDICHILDELKEKLLIYFDLDEGCFFMPEVVRKIITKKPFLKDDNERDQLNKFFTGLLLTRGFIEVEEAKEEYNRLKPANFKLDFKDVFDNPALLIKIDNTALSESGAFVLKSFYEYKKQILGKYQRRYQYSFKSLIAIGTDGFDKNIKPIKAFNELISKAKGRHKSRFKRIIETYHLNLLIFQINLVSIILELGDESYHYKKALKLTDRFANTLPNWSFKGDPTFVIDEKLLLEQERFRENKTRATELCPCGSGLTFSECCNNYQLLRENNAILSHEEQEDFYAVLYNLLFFGNSYYQLYEIESFEELVNGLSYNEFIFLKDRVLKNRQLIKEFIDQLEPEKNSFVEEVLAGLLRSYRSSFLALEFQNHKLLLYDNESKCQYLLSGMKSALSESIPSKELPRIINLRLIPLKDAIVYDVFMEKNIQFMDENVIKIKSEGRATAPLITNISNFQGGFEFIIIEIDNIDEYDSLWLDIYKSISRNKNYQHNLIQINQQKEAFLNLEGQYLQSSSRLDYYYYLRALEFNGVKVGFVHGIVRHFENKGAYFQIGTFGILRKYQNKGYAKHFLEEIILELKNKGVNIIWGIMKSEGFWVKQGFIYDRKIVAGLYHHVDRNDPVYYQRLNSKVLTKTEFAHLFDSEYGTNLETDLEFV